MFLSNVCSRYDELRKRLVELDGQRQQRQQRLAQYKQLEALLQPFKDPQKNLQPNLVTRDGELIQELDKMRMLVARVAGRLSQSKGIQQGDESATVPSMDPDEKLAALLEMT
jgi:negative regulator of sigma E activity